MMDHSSMNHSMPGMSNITNTGNTTLSNGTMPMDHSKCGMKMNHGMKMYFHTDLKIHLLFEAWYLDTWIKVLLACIGIFLLSFSYEALKMFRERLFARFSFQLRHLVDENEQATLTTALDNNHGSSHHSATVHADGEKSAPTQFRTRMQLLSLGHILQTLLHGVQILVAYLLMLAFMTYNVYLCLAVILGAMVGYFCWGWKRSMLADISDHCH